MSDRFDEDLMEDLMGEPEGRSGHSAMDEFEGADEYEAADEFDEADEFESADEFDEADELEEADEYEGESEMDELEEAVTDALEAEDADEFFGGFRNILKTVGKVARKVAPIAKMIPIPQAQLIGGAADLIGNVLADEGDEMDAMDDLADFAEDEDGYDALAPAIAGLAIRGALKHKAALIPRPHRRKLVKVVSKATKLIARKHGPHALVAVPGIVRAARSLVVRKRLPAKHLPKIVARATRLALRSPRALRKFAAAGAHLRTGRRGRHAGGVHRLGRTRNRFGVAASRGFDVGGSAIGEKLRGGTYGGGRSAYGVSRYREGGGGAPGTACPTCRRRSFRLQGPVTLTIQSR